MIKIQKERQISDRENDKRRDRDIGRWSERENRGIKREKETKRNRKTNRDRERKRDRKRNRGIE